MTVGVFFHMIVSVSFVDYLAVRISLLVLFPTAINSGLYIGVSVCLIVSLGLWLRVDVAFSVSVSLRLRINVSLSIGLGVRVNVSLAISLRL